jgi:hypothetical protein
VVAPAAGLAEFVAEAVVVLTAFALVAATVVFASLFTAGGGVVG